MPDRQDHAVSVYSSLLHWVEFVIADTDELHLCPIFATFPRIVQNRETFTE